MFGNTEEVILNNLPSVAEDEYKKVKIMLKHGGEIVLECKNFSLKENNGCINEYKINGICGDYPLYIDRNEIAAIVYLRKSG